MANNIKYATRGKKNPTPEEVMADIKAIAAKNHVYVKSADVETEYFWDCCQRVKASSYYYALKLESLAFRYLRALRMHAEQSNKLRKVG